MGDKRYARPLARLRDADDWTDVLRTMSDDEVVQALAALMTSGDREPYLANVLATEAMNRVHRSGALVRTAAEALVSVNAEGRVTDANPAALRAFQLGAREALVGEPYSQWIVLLDEGGAPIPPDRCPIGGALAHARPLVAREVRMRRANGEPFDALLSVAPLQGEGPQDGAVILFIDITERKRREAIAARERARLHRILDHITEGVVLVTPDGRYEYANPSARRILGFQHPDDLSDLSALAGRAFDADGEPVPLGAFASQRVLDTGLDVRGERSWVQRPDGSRVAIELDARPVVIARRVEAVVCSFDDVTDRTRAEERMGLLASLVQNSEDAILLESIDGIVREWNDAATRLLGYAPHEVTGRHVRMLIPAERLHELADVNARVARGEHVPSYETERVAKDGSRVPVNLAVGPVRDARGRIVALSATYRDIRQLVEHRKHRRAAQERLRSLFENDPLGVFTLDDEGNIQEANAAAQRLVGYDIEELRGQSFAPLVAPHDLERAFENYAHVLEGEARVDDYDVVRKDGALTRLRVTGIPVQEAGRIVGMHGRVQAMEADEASVARQRGSIRIGS